MAIARIIPCLDIKDGRTVKGINFIDLVDAGDPVEQARIYVAAGADELCLLDISASQENRSTTLDLVRAVAAICTIPLIVGGGIRRVEDIRALLDAGADKVTIGSAAIRDPGLIARAAAEFGSTKIIAAIDAKAVPADGGPRFEVFTAGGRQATGLDAVTFARELVAKGAGEILLTSMDRDGTREGYDLALTRAVAEAAGVPAIASGGGGTLAHLAEGVIEGKASAVLAASILHFGEFSIAEAKAHMAAAGIEVQG